MSNLPLLGRRIHIAGSIDMDLSIASTADVERAREFVRELVVRLVASGSTFVVPIDDEKPRSSDNLPVCFDWLILQTIYDNLAKRPRETAILNQSPLIVAIQHHKTEGQIPERSVGLWDSLRGSDLVYVENANQWDMNSKRLEMQALHGDILITLGGGEGVLFLANLYHDAGKPVVPLNFPITGTDKGSRRLFNQALTSRYSERFFHTEDGSPAHGFINRINFVSRHETLHRVETVLELLKALQRPTVFGVRLLNSKHEKFLIVEDYFEGVVKPVVESLGFKLVIIDGKKVNDESVINLELFTKLHRASVVIADMTGDRPNNFIELGYALGRGHRVMVTAEDGFQSPFDTAPVPTHFWKLSLSLADRKEALLEYWRANVTRRRIVEPDPLVP